MAQESARSFLSALCHAGIYKASQGRIARQVTCAALAITCFLGSARLFYQLKLTAFPDWWTRYLSEIGTAYLISSIVFVLGAWVSYRAVNYPKFADFLIAVEAEMNKVSWPTRGELFRSSLVVIVVILGLAALLFGYDALWRFVFSSLGVLRTGS